MGDSFPARAHLVTVLGSTLNRAATSPGVISAGSLPLAVTAARCRYPAGVWSVLVRTRVLRRLARSSAAMICVRWPSWLTATHAEPGSRCSTCQWPPRSAMIAASLPVSYPCWRSCRRAATVPAVRTTGGAGGGRRCAVYPWEVLLICHSPPNSPSKVVRLAAASSLVMPGVVSGIVVPLGWLAGGAGHVRAGGEFGVLHAGGEFGGARCGDHGSWWCVEPGEGPVEAGVSAPEDDPLGAVLGDLRGGAALVRVEKGGGHRAGLLAGGPVDPRPDDPAG